MTNKEIAERIRKHLKSHEADDEWNRYTFETTNRGTGKPEVLRLSRLYNAGARTGGRWIYVTYVSYQGATNLSKAEALAYLEWLDAGNRGPHFQMRRSS